jgi:hypothetical protein
LVWFLFATAGRLRARFEQARAVVRDPKATPNEIGGGQHWRSASANSAWASIVDETLQNSAVVGVGELR